MKHFTKTVGALIASVCIAQAAAASDGLTDGPGLLSGEKGEINVKSLLKHLPNADKQTTSPATDAQEFEQFKQWQDAKKRNSESYQEFKQWLEYQAFKGS